MISIRSESKAKRPRYFSSDQNKTKKGIQTLLQTTSVKLGDEEQDDETFAGLPELKFDDIIDIAL